MKQNINILELFAGIGGFTLGLQNAGFNIKKHYYSEIDKHAIANYKYNYGNSIELGTVTDIQAKHIKHKIDIITFGSTCQDFSLSGKRTGLKGLKSSLIEEAIRLVSEIKPSVFIWENVKGTFSSNNGSDFWAIIKAFTNIGGYRLEWQLLNTDWLLPQNRERIYLIGHLTKRSRPGVFPFTENDFASTKKSNAKKRQSQTKDSCTTIDCKYGQRADSTFIEMPKKARTLMVGGKSGGLHSNMTAIPTVDKTYRRLTEIEAERLQGFPDNWTKYGNYNGTVKEIAKTQRFALIGNAVTTVIVTEIGKRLIDKTKTNIKCHICKSDPGTKPNKPKIWNGFLDKDTSQYVCWKCKTEHYKQKAIKLKLTKGMLYSELPVIIN